MRISVYGVGKSFPVLPAVVVSFQMWLRRDLGAGGMAECNFLQS